MKRFAGAILLALFPAVLLNGCKSDQPGSAQGWFDKLMNPGPQPAVMVAMAFDPNDPDKRREGITMLSNESWGLKEPYLDGYGKIVRNDDNETVRCAAVRALGKARALKYLPVLMQAMSDESANVRWDASLAIDAVAGTFRYDPNVQPAAPTLQKAATQDASVDVRGGATKALRNFRDRDSVKAVIQCLYDEAFSVRYLARLSLVEMSGGKDLGYDPAAWTKLADGKPVNVPGAATRPWWDWGGVTEEDKPSEFSAYETSRPWWDWAGVTDKSDGPPVATSQPSVYQRPWWDWAGVTVPKPASTTTRPASAPAAPK